MHHGKTLLSLGGKTELADSLNTLLVVGFYLLNLGFVTLAVSHGGTPQDWAEVVEVMTTKVGLALMILGAIHLLNLYVLSRVRRRALLRDLPAPVEPSEFLAVP